ncbi:MAG: flagellar filament capping protein FliD [Ignavibacteriaceae bacterium]
MADLLTTSTINSLVQTYSTNESNKMISPLSIRKTKYSNQSTAFNTLIQKLTSLKNELATFNKTGTDSVFSYKAASSSNTSFVAASAGSTSLQGSYEIRVNQLAKKDVAVSASFTSGSLNAVAGMHKFSVVTGDGQGGQFVSNVEVEFNGSETNKTAIEKIQNAVNSDKAVVKSEYKTGTDPYTGGATSFKINLDGKETTISLDGSAANYSDLLDSVVQSINTNVDGVDAVKIADPSDPSKFQLSLTVSDSSKYISITNDTGFDLVSDLNIGVTKEKAASATVSASSFSPLQGSTQLSITAKESGLDYRIMELSDSSTYSALAAVGLNIGSSRPSFDQGLNTPGFIYSDITTANNQLNAKFTFNGLDIQRHSNTVTDIADGLTLNLKSTMAESDNAVSVAVANDHTAIKAKVESFIKQFNDVYTYLKTNSTYNAGTRGALYGDSSAQTIMRNLSSIAGSVLPDTDINSLSKIGISFNSSTGLTLSDSAMLANKVDQDPGKVEALFNSENGVSARLESLINPYLGAGGYLTLKKKTLDNNITSINDKITSTESRINKSAEMLRKRYEQLQTQLATLLSTQNYFM